MRIIVLGCVVATALIAAPAFAGTQEAEACAAKLPKSGKQMYKEVAPHVKKDSDIKQLMRSHVRGMVMSGKVGLSDARSQGPKTGLCLYLLKS